MIVHGQGMSPINHQKSTWLSFFVYRSVLSLHCIQVLKLRSCFALCRDLQTPLLVGLCLEFSRTDFLYTTLQLRPAAQHRTQTAQRELLGSAILKRIFLLVNYNTSIQKNQETLSNTITNNLLLFKRSQYPIPSNY